MSDRKRTGASSAGLSIGPKIQPHYPFPFVLPAGSEGARSDAVPDVAEPESVWKIPLGPIDEMEGHSETSPGPAHAGHGAGLLRRLTHKG
jgi:hypothetical protein